MSGLEAPITLGYHRRPPARTRDAWPAPGFKGLRLTAGRRPSNDVWLMVWEDWAEILRANPGRAMSRTEAGIMRSACLYGSMLNAGCAHVGPILGLYWPRLGLCWAMLGPSWAHVGPMLGPCWPMLRLCWPMLSPLGSYVMLGPCLGHLC